MKFLTEKHSRWIPTNKIQSILIQKVPIEPLQRNKFLNLLTWFLYIIDYLIIIFAISMSIYHPQIQLTWAYFNIITYSKIALSLLHILLQYKILYLFKKITSICYLLFLIDEESKKNKTAQIVIPLFFAIFVDVISCVVRCFTIEQRTIHFDSKYTLKYGFIKEISILILVLSWLFINLSKENQSVFYLSANLIWILCIFAILCDFLQKYYDFRFKRVLLAMDIWVVLTLMLSYNTHQKIQQSITNQQIGFIFVEFFITSVIQLILLLLCISCTNIKPQYILTETKDHQKNSQWQLCYQIELDEVLRAKNNSEILRKFNLKHTKQCNQAFCFLKYYNESTDSNVRSLSLRQAVELLANKQLQNLSKKYDNIRFYYIMRQWQSPDRIYKLFSNENFFEKRQNYRVYQTFIKNQQNSLRIETDLAINENFYEQHLKRVKSILQDSIKHWENLNQIKIDCKQLLQSCHNYLKNAEQLKNIIQQTKYLDCKLAFIIKKILNNVFLQNQQQTPQPIMILRNYFSTHYQAYPAVLISAEKQNFMRIVNANVWMQKASGFTSKQLCSLTIDNLWIGNFRKVHTDLVHARARQNIFHHNRVIKSPAFILDKFGYALYGEGVVMWLNEITGKKWVVIIKPFRPNDAMVITDLKGQIVGVSQNILKFGLDKSLTGCKINEQIFESALKEQAKIGTILSSRNFIQDKIINFKNKKGSDISLKFCETLCLVGIPHFKTFSLVRSIKGSTYKIQSQQTFRHLTNPEDSRTVKTIKYTENFQYQFRFDQSNLTFYQSMVQTQNLIQQQIPLVMEKIDQVQNEISSNQWQEFKQDILQMRLCNEQLQYVQNLPKPNYQAESLPKNFEQDAHYVSTLNQFAFKQKSEYFQKRIKNYYFLIRTIFIICVILILFTIICTFLMIESDKKTFKEDLQKEGLLNSHFVYLVRIGFLPLNQQIFTNVNWKSIMEQCKSEVEQSYKLIDSYKSEIYFIQNQSQYNLDYIDKQLQIAIDQFLKAEVYSTEQSKQFYQLILGKVASTIISYLQVFQQIQNHKRSSNNLRYTYIFLSFCIIVGVCFGLLIKILIKIQQNNNKIFRIIARVPTSIIEPKLVLANRYLDYLNVNSSLDDFNEQIENQSETTQDFPQPKSLYKTSQKQCFIISTIFVFVVIIIIVIGFAHQIYFQYKSVNLYNDVIYHRTVAQINLYTSWMSLMNYPDNLSIAQTRFDQYDANTKIVQQSLFQLSKNDQFSDQFWQFYLKFGMIELPVSENIQYSLYGFDNVMMQQITSAQYYLQAYIQNNFKNLIKTNNSINSFRNRRYSATIQLLFRQTSQILIKQIQQQQQRQYQIYASNQILFSSLLVVCLLSLPFIYKMVAQKLKQLASLQKFLFSLPYQSLIQISKFKFYIHEKLKEDTSVIKKNK